MSEPRTSLPRHQASLEEHARQLQRKNELDDEGRDTPSHGSRREGFTCGSHPSRGEERRLSLQPFPPKCPEQTLPPLQELLRQHTNEDADSAHIANLQPVDTFDLLSNTTGRTSTSINNDRLSRTSTTRSSIVEFAHGVARHVRDLRMFLQPDEASKSVVDHKRRDSHVESANGSHNGNRQERKLSFILPPVVKEPELLAASCKLEKPTVDYVVRPVSQPGNLGPPSKGSIRDRRKVDLGLELPVELFNVPARGRASPSHATSITPSRPRSPKTPWTRNERPKWNIEIPPVTAPPIMEEDQYGEDTLGRQQIGGIGLLPGTDTITSSQSPIVERTAPKYRDGRYLSRPDFKRHRYGWSSTSGSVHDGATEVGYTLDDVKKERQAHTGAELRQLGQTSQKARGRHWRWTSSRNSGTVSSEEAPESPLPTTRRFSINPFKRSARIGNQTDQGKARKKPPLGRLWHTQQPSCSGKLPTSSLDNVPIPPHFIPPGLVRVPTPPSFDAHSDVKGKLADFFFDFGSDTGRRRPKAAPGGHWDSDALLMSYLSADLDCDGEESQEGPEGSHTPNKASHFVIAGERQSCSSSGLISMPGGYPGINNQIPTDAEDHDIWFRVHQNKSPDADTLTALALREEDERRKFEWLIPEHLPNSPLCPLHPIYRGYSKGLCHWHGRNNSKTTDKGKNISKAEDGLNTHKQDYVKGPRKGHVEGKANAIPGRRGLNVGDFNRPEQTTLGVRRRRLDSLSSP